MDSQFEIERNLEIFSEELLEFARKLMQKISDDIDNNIQTPQTKIYSLKNILKNLTSIKQLTPKTIGQIERDILGINLN